MSGAVTNSSDAREAQLDDHQQPQPTNSDDSHSLQQQHQQQPQQQQQLQQLQQQQDAATRQTQSQSSPPGVSSGPDVVVAAPAAGHADSSPAFQVVHPASYLRPRGASRPMTPRSLLNSDDPVDREQIQGLRAIRAFLKLRTSYDVLPLSYRLIILDTSLLVKKSLNILLQNAIVSAPLWDSATSTFAGLLTTSDYINVIQYYWQHPEAVDEVDQFRLDSLREIEKAIHVAPIETVSIHPEKPLYDACRKMLQSRARRIPLIDIDDETGRPLVVSVITQYRILKFIAVNVKETQMLQKPLRDMNVGTYENLQTAHMETPVIDIIHMLVRKNISSVPILDRDGTVINVFESVDVISVIKGGNYDDLHLPVGEALLKRPDDFAGIYSCSVHDRLDTIFDTIRRSRVHRLVVIDENSKLRGVLTLSDILEYILLEGVTEDEA